MGTTILNFFQQIIENGLDGFNRFFPPVNKYSDMYSERFKSLLVFGMAFSVVMMVTAPLGVLYATIIRPFPLNIALLHRIPIEGELFTTPESGIHYLTIFMYFFACFKSISYMEVNTGINKPVHKLLYSFCLMMVSFFIPFEFIYLILYYIFHNIPLYGKMNFLFFGWWKTFPANIFERIIFIDGWIAFGGLYCMWYIKQDLAKFLPTKIKFDKISFALFLGFILVMISWILIPLYQPNVVGFGTKYFPQTIYPVYGYYEDYNMSIPNNGDIYGIITEYWYHNDLIKIHNHLSKALSVAFMFYTFTLRRKD